MPTVLEIQCQLKERGLFKGTSGLKKAQLQDILTNGKTPKAEKSKKEKSPKKEDPKKIIINIVKSSRTKLTNRHAYIDEDNNAYVSKGGVYWEGIFKKQVGDLAVLKFFMGEHREVPSNWYFVDVDATEYASQLNPTIIGVRDLNRSQEKSTQPAMTKKEFFARYKKKTA